MKPRRWWQTPVLLQWRYMLECGDFEGHLWEFGQPSRDEWMRATEQPRSAE
jgi:hypothetical protein